MPVTVVAVDRTLFSAGLKSIVAFTGAALTAVINSVSSNWVVSSRHHRKNCWSISASSVCCTRTTSLCVGFVELRVSVWSTSNFRRRDDCLATDPLTSFESAEEPTFALLSPVPLLDILQVNKYVGCTHHTREYTYGTYIGYESNARFRVYREIKICVKSPRQRGRTAAQSNTQINY